MLIAGIIYAIVLDTILVLFDARSMIFPSGLLLLEIIFIVSATGWAFFVFGSGASLPSRSSAIFKGIICIVLSYVTFSVILILASMTAPDPGHISDDVLGYILTLVVVPIYGSIALCLTPQIFGGFAGYVIWRLSRPRAAP